MTAEVDTDGNFTGHSGRDCGEHRTVGAHRAWCFDCVEWCYPRRPCVRCPERSETEILDQILDWQ